MFARFAAIGLMAALAFAIPATAQEQKPMTRSITVPGHGEIREPPDLAVVAIGVLKQAATAREALDLNNTAMADILKALAAAGIEAKDIQTSGFYVAARFDYSKSSSGSPGEAVGFDAGNTVSVIVRKLDTLGTVLDAVVSVGANQINGVTFQISSPQQKQDEARKLAFADAQRKAALYAQAAGASLGAVIALSEGGGYSAPPPMMNMAAERSAGAVPIAQGELTIAADISVTWEIK